MVRDVLRNPLKILNGEVTENGPESVVQSVFLPYLMANMLTYQSKINPTFANISYILYDGK